MKVTFEELLDKTDDKQLSIPKVLLVFFTFDTGCL